MKVTVNIKGKDHMGTKANVSVKLDTVGLTKSECQRLKRSIANSFAATIRGLDYTAFSVLEVK